MQTLPITTALCGFILGLLIASQCNTGGGAVVGSDTTRTIITPPSESVADIPASIDYHLPDVGKMISGISTSLNDRKPQIKYVRVPVYVPVHDTTQGRNDTTYVLVPQQCEGCRFTATSEPFVFGHGDKISATFSYPAGKFGFDFQPAPDTATTITNYVVFQKNFAVTLGVYGGYDVFRKDYSAGIAVQIGVKLTEF